MNASNPIVSKVTEIE